MMADSYTSSNDSALQTNISVITKLPFSECYFLRPSAFVYFANDFIRILFLLPLSTLILGKGLKRQQQQRSNSMMSHSDFFTYHLMIMELIGVSGIIISCCAVFTLHVKTYLVGIHMFSVSWYGELYFHVVTCVEHFLAVVHPVTYVSLKSERGIKIRNICTGCVWLLSVGNAGLSSIKDNLSQVDFILVTLSVVVISLCSLSVLCILTRPRPGGQGADAKRVDQSKRRAFFTILVILGVLLSRCVWSLAWISMSIVQPNLCMIMAFGDCVNTPCSLVLPLLFLQRAGLLPCCRKAK